MDKPLVTVYIPCHNYGRYLRRAVESVLQQSYVHWELFLVDEASDDESLQLMQEFAKSDTQRIRVLAHTEPIGLQRTANEVLAHAEGRYMIRLDADDWFDESALLILVNALESDKSCGIVWGNFYYTDQDGKVIGVELSNQPGMGRAFHSSAPHGAGTMVRTRALKAVGGYSEDVDAQDGWELWYKLMNQVGAASVSTPIFYYRQHGSSLSRNSERLLAARTRIFDKLASQLDGSYSPSVLTVIGVREHYPNNPGVPYQNVQGSSLLQRALHACHGAHRVSDVMVSSSSESVLEFSEELEVSGKVEAHLRRKRDTQELDGVLPVEDILLDAGRYYRQITGHDPDIVVFCNIHSVHRTNTHIDKALNVLRINQHDSVVSVQDERDVLFRMGSDGLTVLNPGRLRALAFERERVLRFNGALIAVWWEVLQSGNLLGEKIGYIEMSELESRRHIQAAERFTQGFAV